jgi:hypothetical protein
MIHVSGKSSEGRKERKGWGFFSVQGQKKKKESAGLVKREQKVELKRRVRERA